MKPSSLHFADLLSQALGYGLSPDPASATLRNRPAMGLPLGNAKQAALESPVWNDEREEHEMFVEEILEALDADTRR